MSVGTVVGAASAAWASAPPAGTQLAQQMKSVGGIVGRNTATFAALGATYATVECSAESIRGQRDVYNSMVAGCAAGVVIGARTGSVKAGLGACAAFAAMTAAVRQFGSKAQHESIMARRFPDRS